MTRTFHRQQAITRVWADIGGTFTDCFVHTLGKRVETKVLSSGLTRVEAVQSSENDTYFIKNLPGSDIRNFWRGAKVTLIDQNGVSTILGSVTFQNQSQITVDNDGLGKVNPFKSPVTLELNANLEAPVLATRVLLKIPLEKPLPPLDVRLGTTRGTNALLTRSGAKTALMVTKGFHDLLEIGEQDRPDLFTLNIKKHAPLTDHVIEVDERLDAAGKVLKKPDADQISRDIKQAIAEGVQSLAISLLHSHLNDEHERQIEKIARRCGIKEISRSSDVAPLIKYVSRTETTTLDAYLNPILNDYLQRVRKQFGGVENCDLKIMTSNGNLVAPASFRGRDSILSGPAGGVVALSEIARRTGHSKIIGLDMGGTSTDVSRYEGQVGRRHESRVAGIRVMTPMMDIETVAAGGGSVCSVSQHGRLSVGPASAGAEPGPACYGKGGPLTVTDVNLLLGRIPADRFPFPLDVEAAHQRLQNQTRQIKTHRSIQPEELAEGFLDIAVTHMAEAVRTVSTAQGSDAREMALAGFGGAAGQHLCRIADTLGMKTIIDHPDSGLLSALGMGIANLGQIASHGIYQIWDGNSELEVGAQLSAASHAALEKLHVSPTQKLNIINRFEIDVRYTGTDASLALELEPRSTLAKRFHRKHLETFGYSRDGHPLELVAVRCEATVREAPPDAENPKTLIESRPIDEESSATKIWHSGSWITTQCHDRNKLNSNQIIHGPALIVGPHSTLVLEPDWVAKHSIDGMIIATRIKTTETDQLAATPRDTLLVQETSSSTKSNPPNSYDTLQSLNDERGHDPILLEVLSRRLQGIADAMGEVLRRTSISVNIKERRDYSCAIFTKSGTLVANAPHVPVHLGAMGHTVRRLIEAYPLMHVGDCYLSNDPYSGGSHLPDVTSVTPVFCSEQESGSPDFFVATRAHHAEIGGVSPGSMPPHATSLAEEGVLIQNFALVRNGKEHHAALRKLLTSATYPSRCPDENLADIDAQLAAGLFGNRLLKDLANVYSPTLIHSVMQKLLDVSGDTIQSWIQTLPEQPIAFRDELDDGTSIAVELKRKQELLHIHFDTGPVHPNGFNATPAIVTAATLYVFRCLAGSELPLCEGALRDVRLSIPAGLLDPPSHSDPNHCAAVVAGNVETSQRVVDVLLGALGVAAASQGTMNNLLLGNDQFGYYETIAGGSGATAVADGADAVHTHMTNTRITDPEVLETRLPVRLIRFAIRKRSGGRGRFQGGDGVIREFEFLEPLVLSLITSRRTNQPYGLENGEAGCSGRNRLIRQGIEESLDSRTTTTVTCGDRLIIETPGGGGWGKP